MTGRQIALCGVLSALAVTLMLAGGLLGVATYCAPLLAMGVLLPVLEECGAKAAVSAWAAASILGLLLVSDRELALVYAAFGWYPALRPTLNRIPLKFPRILVKLALLNGVLLVYYQILLHVVGLPEDAVILPRWTNGLLLIFVNGLFLMVDVIIGRYTELWRRKWRKMVFKT